VIAGRRNSPPFLAKLFWDNQKRKGNFSLARREKIRETLLTVLCDLAVDARFLIKRAVISVILSPQKRISLQQALFSL